MQKSVLAVAAAAVALATPASAGDCLCVFDIDRTLTGKQQEARCPLNHHYDGVYDDAYTHGDLTLSPVGQTLQGTFCAARNCYVGIVSAGDAAGFKSSERDVLTTRLKQSGGRLTSKEWCGPSQFGEARKTCEGVPITSPLVLGCVDGTKHHAVGGIVSWLKKTENADIKPEDVFHFDDRVNNLETFNTTGFNAIQISCDTRDGLEGNLIGLCGATPFEIVEGKGVQLCKKEEKTEETVVV